MIALGGNALGNTLPEQMQAVKTTAKALCDLIEEGHQVVVVHRRAARRFDAAVFPELNTAYQ